MAQAAHIGRLLLHCALMLLFSALLYSAASRWHWVSATLRCASVLRAAMRRCCWAAAIRAVALGVVVTALVQSVLGGIGLAVSGIPAATLLTMLIFICCVAQLGPLLVLVPAIIWLYWHGDTTGAPCCWSGAAW